MRKVVKTVSESGGQDVLSEEQGWLDLESLARVEVTSELPEFPIESALAGGRGRKWRASGPGAQTILVKFDQPQRLRRIVLRFVEEERERTQEFTVSSSTDGGLSFREILRQQWNFSPSGSCTEAEDYRVDLSGVTALKLAINPDIGRGEAPATLSELRLA
jgi:F5/8 type C domain